MSTVKLTAFAAFNTPKKGADLEIVYGASRGRISGEGADARRVLEMGSVPLGKGFRAPEGGLLMLYGFRDNIEELRQRRTQAREAGSEFHYAEVEVDVGEIVVGLVDRKALKGLRFVNVKRMTAGLQSNILLEFSRYVEEEGGSVDEEMSKIQQIAQRPDLFGRLLDNDPDMKSLEVIVIPVADDPKFPGRVRQLAYVRQGAKIVDIEQNTEINQFVMPDWFAVPRKSALKSAAKVKAASDAAAVVQKAATKKAPAKAVTTKVAAKKAPVKAVASKTSTKKAAATAR